MFDVCVNAKEKVMDNEITHSTEKSFKESFILFSFTFSKQVRFLHLMDIFGCECM